jgi:hypothetical protein
MDFLQSFAFWLETTRLHPVMHYPWVWPTLEAIHFIGITLLLGPVLLLDLRMLGVAKQLPVGPLHRLVPWALFGFVLALITGTCFIIGSATAYLGNTALYLKIPAILLAGVNALAFYVTRTYRKVQDLGPGDDAPAPAKAIAFVSLFLWFSVITLGRMIGIL